MLHAALVGDGRQHALGADRWITSDLAGDAGVAAVDLNGHDDRTVRQAADGHELRGPGSKLDLVGNKGEGVGDHELCVGIGGRVGDRQADHAVTVHACDRSRGGGEGCLGNVGECDESRSGHDGRQHEF